jgi:hypothetical protein
MALVVFVALLGLVAWLYFKRVRTDRRRVLLEVRIGNQPDDRTRWRDPIEDADPDTVVYNGYNSVPLRVQIRYTDGQGQSSEREVDIRSYDDTTQIGQFEGFCHLRGAVRSFYFARVTRAVCVESGELIGDLRRHLNALWEQSTGPALRLLSQERKLDLEVLLYMARADKAMRAPELEIITQYCRTTAGDERLGATEVRRLLDYTAGATFHGFKIKLAQLLKDRPADALRVAQACRDIVATQKTVHTDEQMALDYMERKLEDVRS